MNNEEWRPVVGFEGRYEVSDSGRVASLPTRTWPTRRILASVANERRGGYLYVTLRRDGKQYSRKVHQLVCEAFVGPRPGGTITRHLDDDPLNNAPSNLRWGTHADNLADRIRNRGHHNSIKIQCVHGHDLSGDNLGINTTTGGRFCRWCDRAAKRRYAERNSAA